MNISRNTRISIGSPGAISLAAVAVIAAVAIAASAGAQDAPKTYSLFTGANISIATSKGLYPVQDVNGSSWVVNVNGQPQVVSGKEGPISIKITPSKKLTEVSAAIANLKGERGYTFENDPITRQTRALVHAADVNAGYQTAVNQAQAQLDTANMMAASALGRNSNASFGGSNGATTQTSLVQMAQNGLNAASASAGSDLELTGERLSPGCDAMEVDFEVSAARQLNSPYVVTITKFHPHGGDPGTFQTLVYAKALDPIGAQPKSVHFLEGGFPLGFELLGFEMHLYNHGQEIATNVSTKRTLFTRDEAFEYVRTKYLDAHRVDTLPAVPAMGRLPEDLRGRLAEGKYGEPVYVRVSRDGLPDELYLDAACSRKVDDPYLESAVRTIRFKPALEKGKPVEGVVTLKLSQLVM